MKRSRRALRSSVPAKDYDRLYDAALCRAGADWIVGSMLPASFSVLYGATLNVGRVMSPTLALLVKREAEISSFESKPFYAGDRLRRLHGFR